MKDNFREYLKKFIFVFFNDILIYNPAFSTHLNHLRVTLEILMKNQLMINKKKCKFRKPKLEYLVHIFSIEGIQADPTKIESMVNWPIPKDLRALREFLGLNGYYHKFVKDYGKITAPLTDLLTKLRL